MKHGRDVLRRTLGMLGKQPGVVATVFAHSGFHNRDAALLRSAEYRRLVEGSISDLPSRLFDRDRIGSVLKADLNSDRPASGKLFEILISFSEFSKLRSDLADLARCSTDNGGMMVEDSIVV